MRKNISNIIQIWNMDTATTLYVVLVCCWSTGNGFTYGVDNAIYPTDSFFKVELKVGKDAKISCIPDIHTNFSKNHAYSNKRFSYWWVNEDGHIMFEHDSAPAALILENVKPSDSGHYQCQVKAPSGDVIHTYHFNVTVFSLPSFTYDTVLDYDVSNKACDLKKVNLKAQALWGTLCKRFENKKKDCMYTIKPQCVDWNSTHHKWRITVTANMKRKDVLERYLTCNREVACIVKKVYGPIRTLITFEKHKKGHFRSKGVIFVGSTNRNKLNVHCRIGFATLDSNRCSPCVPGYASSDGESPCFPCPKGSYSTSYAQTECFKCPLGKVTRLSGSSSLKKCISAYKTRHKAYPGDDDEDYDDEFEEVVKRELRTQSAPAPLTTMTKLFAAIGAVTFIIAVIIAATLVCILYDRCKKIMESKGKESCADSFSESTLSQTNSTDQSSTTRTISSEPSTPMYKSKDVLKLKGKSQPVKKKQSKFTYETPSSMATNLSIVYYEDIEAELLGLNRSQNMKK